MPGCDSFWEFPVLLPPHRLNTPEGHHARETFMQEAPPTYMGNSSALGRRGHEQRVRLRNLGRRMEKVKLEPGFRGSGSLCAFPASLSLSLFPFGKGSTGGEGGGC